MTHNNRPAYDRPGNGRPNPDRPGNGRPRLHLPLALLAGRPAPATAATPLRAPPPLRRLVPATAD